ncbi:hypothetical protein NE237_010567 [Protea cynaroides]|uniref:3-beta hydroxysteroid dehydrogenase/isomerase domain-containing protein n=1 Tax=Protea cynaroides TaxID=273540 RepID=A0A9Q0KZY5_9MAGN|nr:hypothetical protein NE237_010567 [Protea cynaroides]
MAIDLRAGAAIVHGKEACDRFSRELIKDIGFPSGLLPGGELIECGRVKATGFTWWKCKDAYEQFNVQTKSMTSYAAETTAYVEKGRMKKMTGVKSKQMFMWIPLSEMSTDGNKITFKASIGITKSLPIEEFMSEEEKKAYLEQGGRVPLGSVQNPEEEIIEPAVTGTHNVLETCSETKVKRVVVMSSGAAVASNPNWPKNEVMDETCWSDKEYCKETKN